MIDNAISEKLVKKYKYGGIVSYKTLDVQNSVIVRDPIDERETQTDDIPVHEHCISQTAFKEFAEQMTLTVQGLELEIVKLKSELESSRNTENSAAHHPGNYVNFLQQTITSLIAQLSPQIPPHVSTNEPS